MIVMVIVAIVTAIAVPSYSAHVQKTRRAEGVSTLLELAILMERYYANNGTYLAATPAALMGSSSSENGFYALTINPLAAESYTLQAAPANVQSADGCGTFTLSSVGNQAVTGGSLPLDDCWRK
jgi:type IV pilus assembly protein PilE